MNQLARLNGTKVGLGLLTLVSTVALIEVIFTSRRLRPIADDYGSADAMISGGFVNYITSNYMNFSGELSRVISDAVLVGFPVSYANWNLASSLTFTFATAAVLFAFAVLMRIGMPTETGTLFIWVALPTAALGWWAYWWAPAGLGTREGVRSLPEAITHWQIINSSYVFLVSLSIGIWFWGAVARHKQYKLALGVSAASALLVGLSGPSLGLSAFATLAILLGLNLLSSASPNTRPSRGSLIASLGGVGLGLVISQTSPGTRERAAYLMNSEGAVPRTPGNLLSWTVPTGFLEWFNGIWNVGALVILGLTVTLGFMLARLRQLQSQPLLSVALAVMGFSFVYAVLNRLAEAFSYVTFWHQIGFRTVQALGLFTLGLALGAWLSRFKVRSVSIGIGAALAIFVVWAVSAERLMVGSINDRYATWNIGAAPLEGMPDIENSDTWVYRSWLVLAEFRGDAPDRGVK